MDDISDMKRREVEAFLSFVAGAETERAVKARSYHILATYEQEDFERVSDLFTDVGATAGFAFLGRDVDDQAPSIEMVADRGHEVVLHGHRHVKFGGLSYETAHDDLSQGMAAIEDAASVTPTGFFAPFKAVSEGTLKAAAELDLGWVLGKPDEGATVPAEVELIDSVYPHDSRLLEGGTSPADTFEQLTDAAADGETFLFHPNLLDYYDANDEFAEWIEGVGPVSVGEQVEDGGVGVVLDCLRPLRIE
ncbi:polysaccharide deacetylase family protein [Haladaptatus sp. CMSO5]|uniref:polysaccharide deacetylase family protein n=1 Tax=Haladaptatus sp. CMSO5 TaxID=3120514 RepID=UPI002FCDFBA8